MKRSDFDFKTWHVIKRSNLKVEEVLASTFKFDQFLTMESKKAFLNRRFIIHRSLYPYSTRKQYSNLYTITDVDSGKALIGEFQLEDLEEIIINLLTDVTINNIIKALDREPPLKKRLI